MCTIPPPAPPLPPPLPPQQPKADIALKSLQMNNAKSSSSKFSDICQWASHQPQLWEACANYNICLHQTPFKYNYKHIESILQVGPTCGLCALSMLVNGDVTADEMLNIAKMAGYTNNGEMFSCRNMVSLSQKVFSLAEVEKVNCSLRKGGLFSHETIEQLLNGAVLLVPYDADCNHCPCLKQGRKAHWAIVCGVIIINDPGEDYNSDPANVYVLCRHGKSRYLAVWRLHELAKSNKNLWEFFRRADNDKLVYILPEGGVGGKNGLRDQYLIFNGV